MQHDLLPVKICRRGSDFVDGCSAKTVTTAEQNPESSHEEHREHSL
jgi:hypothetical protein